MTTSAGVGIDDGPFDDVADERERDAERRDDFRVAREPITEAEPLRGVRDERGRAASAADDHDGRAIEIVVGDQLVDRRAQLCGREIEDVSSERRRLRAERVTG